MAAMPLRTPLTPGHFALSRMLLVLLVCLVGLSGCQIRTDAELAQEDAIRQQMANAAADIFEAMVAIERGVPVAIPASAIKITAATIIQASGRQYGPADAYLRTVTKPVPSTGGAP